MLPFFDATALEVPGEIEVSDGRFSIAVVAAGDGRAEGDFGRQPIRRGQTFALPASLPVRIRAGREPVRVIRCLGRPRHDFRHPARPGRCQGLTGPALTARGRARISLGE